MTGKICVVYLKFQSLIKNVILLGFFVLRTWNWVCPGISHGKAHVTFYWGSIINDASPVVPFALWLPRLGWAWVGLGWCIKWLCLLDVSVHASGLATVSFVFRRYLNLWMLFRVFWKFKFNFWTGEQQLCFANFPQRNDSLMGSLFGEQRRLKNSAQIGSWIEFTVISSNTWSALWIRQRHAAVMLQTSICPAWASISQKLLLWIVLA